MISCKIKRLRLINVDGKEIDPVPERQTGGAVGLDLRAAIEDPVFLEMGDTLKIPTGVAIETPPGWYVQIWGRSSLGSKGLDVFAGIIDEDYRGEIHVVLNNCGRRTVTVNPGERVGQMVFLQHHQLPLEVVEELSPTERGTKGFGSTGKR